MRNAIPPTGPLEKWGRTKVGEYPLWVNLAALAGAVVNGLGAANATTRYSRISWAVLLGLYSIMPLQHIFSGWATP